MTTKPHRDFRFHAPAVLRVFHWHLTHCPPFWMVRRNVTRSAIQAALQRGQLEPEPWDTALHVLRLRSAAARRRWHAGRCAYLVTHGWTDGIAVEVDRALGDGPWMLTIQNGSHRLRAAAYRGDPMILLHVAGDLALFQDYTGLGVLAGQPSPVVA